MRIFPILIIAGFVGYSALHSGSGADDGQGQAGRRSASGQGDFEWKGRVAPGRSIEIKDVNGSVRARSTDGAEVVVSAVKHEGRRGDADEVTFEVVEHADGVTICAMYPSGAGDEPNECRPGHHGRMQTDHNDTEVDFTVRVPRGVHFVGRTVNGDVETERLNGNAYGHTVNGSVDVRAEGYAEATTVNGSIRAALGRTDWTGTLEFTTVNGSITLMLPAGVSAAVAAKTVNGGIDTDFPLTVQGRFGPRRIAGTIGNGGRDLRLETVNGGISLRRGG